MALVQRREHAIRQRFDGADDEQRAQPGELREQPPLGDDVLDLGREAEADLGVLGVTSGCSACSARAMRIACIGPLRKSGSPKSMWRAPAAICRPASASTISAGTAKNRPW
jgi:hypothetical protein